MKSTTKLLAQFKPKLSEFRQSQLIFGVAFIIGAIERHTCGSWNMRTLNSYVLAHDYCGVYLKDATISKKAERANSVLESIAAKYHDKPSATDLQIKALWAWYFQLVEDIKHIPADVFGSSLYAAKIKEETEVKAGRFASRDELLAADRTLGLIYD